MRTILLLLFALALSAGQAFGVDYFAVCCDRILVRVEDEREYYCDECKMFPIKSSETMKLPPNCEWYNMRRSAERALYKKDTCK